MTTTTHLLDEHRRLADAWLSAEQERVDLLQNILGQCVGKCTMDYPDGLFNEYQEALGRAARANQEYFHWLARQGIQSR
jgi:hypothetical protein